ncbi:hypothetical protein [Streptomyces somaliensis]|uniref:hypothetical protein n=1 Tax=Streptomyces somaliensis TaxID=78355 RepID=UPI0034E970D1|nr:hypothetical protein [Streptomyces somaliensis]
MRPILCRSPDRLSSRRSSSDVYSLPRSECAMQPGRSLPWPGGHRQRVDDQARPVVVGHRVADDLAGGQVQPDRGEFPRPAGRRDERTVCR